MKSIVTGGAGFIGSHVVDALLDEKIEVTVMDNFSTGRPQNIEHVRNQIELVECNLDVKGDWDKHFVNVDWVLHLAALADIVIINEDDSESLQDSLEFLLRPPES